MIFNKVPKLCNIAVLNNSFAPEIYLMPSCGHPQPGAPPRAHSGSFCLHRFPIQIVCINPTTCGLSVWLVWLSALLMRFPHVGAYMSIAFLLLNCIPFMAVLPVVHHFISWWTSSSCPLFWPLLRVILPWTFTYEFTCKHVISFFQDPYLRVGLLGGVLN